MVWLYKTCNHSIQVVAILIVAVFLQGCNQKQVVTLHHNISDKETEQVGALSHPDDKHTKHVNSEMPLVHDESDGHNKNSKTHTSNNDLDFEIENLTGKTLYVCCFSYIRKSIFSRWHWTKSPVYKVDQKTSQIIAIDHVEDEQDKKDVYGYLAVLDSQEAADAATFELLKDRNKLDLDQLIKLKEKKVTIEVEKYGLRGSFFEYDFVKKIGKEKTVPGITFSVENQTGKPLLVCCFSYEKKAKSGWIAAEEGKDDMSVWHFEKTPVVRIEPEQSTVIDIGKIVTYRDRSYIRGYLGVFDINEEKLANDVTYELLDTRNTLNIGELAKLKDKKIVIEVEKYGSLQDFIDFVIKPTRKIDFTAIKK